MLQLTTTVLASFVLLAPPVLADDCNGNGVPDDQDIASGASADCNANGIPDECDVGELALYYDFDGSELPDGVTISTSGLWKVTTSCAPGGPGGGGKFMYFGIPGQCNHENGNQVGGAFTIHGVTVPESSAHAVLKFSDAFDSECCDWAEVTVNDTHVFYRCCDGLNDWTPVEVDLSPWAGQTVDIAWHFYTVDSLYNDYYGWAVDEIQVGFAGPLPDCDSNGVPDECDVAAGTHTDFNQNSETDQCELRVGEEYCTSNPNSSGQAATMFAIGSDSVGDQDLTLVSMDLPTGKLGYYLVSPQQGWIPFLGGGQGSLCLGAPIARFSHVPGGVLSTGSSGVAGFRVDFDDLPHGVAFNPAETWNFQFWFRDHNPDSTSNTTTAWSVVFL